MVLEREIGFMSSDGAQEHGLNFYVRKCSLRRTAPPSQEMDHSYPVSLARIRQSEHYEFGPPVGEQLYLVEEIFDRNAKLEAVFTD